MAARTTKPSSEAAPAADEAVQVVQDATARAQALGFFGVEADPTPNSNYTVAGALEGAPTPETDLDHGRGVRHQLDETARQR